MHTTGLFDGYPLQHLLLSHFITCYLVVGLVWLWEAFEAVKVRDGWAVQGVTCVIAACSTNYNTQALSNVELVVVEALEIAANECLAMLVSLCVCVCVCVYVCMYVRMYVCM